MPKPIYIVVTPFFPSPESWRGAYCLDFVKALMREGTFDVRVFVPGGGPDYDLDGVHVTRFPTRQLPSNAFPFLFTRSNARSFVASVERTGIDWRDVAVCHGHTANFAIYPLAAKAKNPACRALLHHHDPQSFGLNLGRLRHNALYTAFLFRQLRRLHEQIDCHVFVSEMSRRSFLAAPNTAGTLYADYARQMRGPRLFRCRPAKIRESVVLHNGVDTRIFHPLAVGGRTSPLPSERFVIGCIANFIDWKDQATLIRAAARVRDEKLLDGAAPRLVFVGTGPTRAACERLADGLGVAAEFRDEVRHERLPAFYQAIDLFVLPSYWEGFGCVFTEAHACGVPYLCCTGQGISELTPPEWMVAPGDDAALARKIAWVRRERPQQMLLGEWRIDPLVSAFVNANGFDGRSRF